MINEFLNWAQQQPNSEFLHNLASRACSDRPITAWIVSTEQLLAWVRNPTPLSQLDDFADDASAHMSRLAYSQPSAPR